MLALCPHLMLSSVRWRFLRLMCGVAAGSEGRAPDVIVYSVRENGIGARAAVDAFPAGHKPLHAFCDLMDLLPDDDKEELVKMWKRTRQMLDDVQAR